MSNGYSTQDIRFAAFLKAKGKEIIEVRTTGGAGKKFCTFVFSLTDQERAALWRAFQNDSPESSVPARKLLEEYEGLKTERHKGGPPR